MYSVWLETWRRAVTAYCGDLTMPLCPKCRCYWRTPPGEERDHECPRCGWCPWDINDEPEEDDEPEDDE